MDVVPGLVETAREHVALMIGLVFVAAALEAMLGFGVVIPGETALVLVGASLGMEPMLMVAIVSGAGGAFVGDHVGFLVGRSIGPRLGRSRVVRRVGTDKWDRACALMRRRGFRVIVVARLLPGVRTFVAAAAGASRLRYACFVVAAAVAAALWSTLWLAGGALAGQAFSYVAVPVPVWVGVAVLIVAVLTVRWLRARRARRDYV